MAWCERLQPLSWREACALGSEIEVLTPETFWDAAATELSGNKDWRSRGPATSNGGLDERSRTPFMSQPKVRFGYIMRRICIRRGLPFTTSLHTRFPDYLAGRLAVGERWASDPAHGHGCADFMGRARRC